MVLDGRYICVAWCIFVASSQFLRRKVDHGLLWRLFFYLHYFNSKSIHVWFPRGRLVLFFIRYKDTYEDLRSRLTTATIAPVGFSCIMVAFDGIRSAARILT